MKLDFVLIIHIIGLGTCASLSPSSILSRDWRRMLHFSCFTLPCSNVCRLSSGSCRFSSRLQFSPLSASSPAITCCVLHRISSAENIASVWYRRSDWFDLGTQGVINRVLKEVDLKWSWMEAAVRNTVWRHLWSCNFLLVSKYRRKTHTHTKKDPIIMLMSTRVRLSQPGVRLG